MISKAAMEAMDNFVGWSPKQIHTICEFIGSDSRWSVAGLDVPEQLREAYPEIPEKVWAVTRLPDGRLGCTVAVYNRQNSWADGARPPMVEICELVFAEIGDSVDNL